MSDLWEHPPKRQAVTIDPPLRPGQMLERYGKRRDVLCGDCAHFFMTSRVAPRCRLSLQGNREGLGWAWYAHWLGCGQWRPRDESTSPPAPARLPGL